MLDREKRLNEVYEHVHRYFNIHTKGEFADYIKYARAYISSAMNGNEKYLTDKLFDSICKAYPGVFDLHYLLTGDGQLLTIEEEVKSEDIEKMVNPATAPQAIDYTFLIEKAVEKATAYADKTIAILEKQIAEKDKQLEDKDMIITLLQQKIAAYEATQQLLDDPLRKHNFPVGVADDGSVHVMIDK